MGTYSGRYAESYDIFYADKPYAEEVVFIDQCLKMYGLEGTHRLLELACGTGIHSLLLADLDYEIIATDNSEDMLARARQKSKETSSSVTFYQQDMRTLDVPGAPFDAIICLFDSIGYVVSNEALAQVLQGVYHHLRPEGVFIFEFWHSSAMLKGYDPVRVRRWPTSNGELIRISETRLQPAKQTANVCYSVYELRKNGTYSAWNESHINRYFSVPELAYWLSTKDFTPLKWFAGFSFEEAITAETWHIVAVARKNTR